jgi:hypothetical protein
VVTSNWLSGGNGSRYPPGNRFEKPFDAGLTAAASASPTVSTPTAAGADVARMLGFITPIRTGVMVDVPQRTNMGIAK